MTARPQHTPLAAIKLAAALGEKEARIDPAALLFLVERNRDLLAALKEASDILTDCGPHVDDIIAARWNALSTLDSAIARAEGGAK